MRSAFLLGLAILGSMTLSSIPAFAQEFEELKVEPAAEAAEADMYPTVRQWVILDESRQFRGRLVTPGWEDAPAPVVGADVMVTGPDNVVRHAEGVTNTIGEFVVADLEPGIYTLFAASPKAVACTALHVIGSNDGAGKQSETLTVSAAKISQERILSAISRYLTKSIKRAIPMDVPHAQAMTDNSDAGSGYRIVQTDGGLTGRILGTQTAGAPLMNVLVYRGGSMIAKTTTDESGEFFVSDLAPAAYGLVVMGPQGMAIMGIELLPEPNGLELTQNSAGRYFVNAQTEATFAIQLAPIAQDSPELQEIETPQDNDAVPAQPPAAGDLLPPTPLPPLTRGGGGGVGGGGPAGIGGGGGLGAIGIGAIGAGAAAAAIDDDDDAIVPPAASPATP
ncbi:MAG: carboxypeptidase-like regulatory domain-containing protein [Planctomycetota bacterium]